MSLTSEQNWLCFLGSTDSKNLLTKTHFWGSVKPALKSWNCTKKFISPKFSKNFTQNIHFYIPKCCPYLGSNWDSPLHSRTCKPLHHSSVEGNAKNNNTMNSLYWQTSLVVEHCVMQWVFTCLAHLLCLLCYYFNAVRVIEDGRFIRC